MSEHLLQWVSSKLALNIKSIEQEQFNDGVIILRLLSVLTGETLEPHQSTQKGLAMQKNAAKILTFTQQRNINIGDVGVAELLSGKEKDVLRIMFYLFSSFAPKQEIEQFNKINQTSGGSSSTLFPLIDMYTKIPSSKSEVQPVKPTSDTVRANRLSFARLSISDQQTTPSPSSSASVGSAAKSTQPASIATKPLASQTTSANKPLSSEKSAASSSSPSLSAVNASNTGSPSTKPKEGSSTSVTPSKPTQSSTSGVSTTPPANPPVATSALNAPAPEVAKSFLQNSMKELKDKLDKVIPMKPKSFIDYCEDHFKSSIASFEEILKTSVVTEKEASQLIEQFKKWLKEFMDKYRQKNNEVYVTKSLPIVKQNVVALADKLASCTTPEEQQKVMEEFKSNNDLFDEIQMYMPELSPQIYGITSQIAEIKSAAQDKLIKKNKDKEKARIRKQKEDAEKKALQEALDKAKREKEEAEAKRMAAERQAQEEIARAKREKEEAEAKRIAAEKQRLENEQKRLEAERKAFEAEKARLQLEKEQAELKAKQQVVHHHHSYYYDSSSDSSSSDSSSSEDFLLCHYCHKRPIAPGHYKYCWKHSTSKYK